MEIKRKKKRRRKSKKRRKRRIKRKLGETKVNALRTHLNSEVKEALTFNKMSKDLDLVL